MQRSAVWSKKFCRCYSVVNRAKERAGIPLDIIRPKPGTRPVTPKPSSKTIKPNPLVVAEEKKEKFEWKTQGLAKEASISDNIAEEQSGSDAQQRRASNYHHVDRKGEDTAPPLKVIRHLSLDPMRQERKQKESYETSEIEAMMAAKRRQPAGLAERLIKVATVVEQPNDPHILKVAVIGAANAGKSTLVNTIVGSDVSVVSARAHTTRDRVLAVWSHENYQVIFLDTPGVVPNNREAKLNRTLTTSSWRSLDEADHVLVVVDGYAATKGADKETYEQILDRLKEKRIPTTLVMNKVDMLHNPKADLKQIVARYRARSFIIDRACYISALHGTGLDTLKNRLLKLSKPGNWLYPREQKNEMSDLKRVEELIRVEFFKRLHQYLPYMLKQENAGWTEMPDGTLFIEQNVYVERDSQQKIVVGANGSLINAVMEDARKQIAKAFNRRVKLHIQVKVKKR